MAKRKLERFAELKTFPNVFEYPSPELKEKWHTEVFKNGNPITLELACGRGEYTLALARRYPQRNFVGIDLKGARLWRGAKTALEENLTNAIFVRMPIERILDIFSEKQIEEIWLPFPDPYPKRSKENKRLTSPKFLSIYKTLMLDDGLIHFKTDDDDFYQYTLETLREQKCTIHRVINDVHANTIDDEFITLKTTYENKHIAAGKIIKYVCFSV